MPPQIPLLLLLLPQLPIVRPDRTLRTLTLHVALRGRRELLQTLPRHDAREGLLLAVAANNLVVVDTAFGVAAGEVVEEFAVAHCCWILCLRAAMKWSAVRESELQVRLVVG